MLLFLAASFLTVLLQCVGANSNNALASSLAARAGAPLNPACNATCSTFTTVKKTCSVPHCGCTVKYLQAQGDCLVCQTSTPEDAAAVQFLIDTETNQCHINGIPIDFRLQLPPAAAAIVAKVDAQSAELRREQRAFLALQIAGGHIGLVIVLAFAIFSRKVRRDPTFLNFCITWIFSSIVFSLVLYRGTEGNTISNSLGFIKPDTCLAQAAMTNGAQVMTACSTMGLVIQLWLGLRAAIKGDLTSAPVRKWITVTLLVLPYVLFFAFAIPSIFVGRVHIVIEGTSLQRVLPTNFYCSIVELSPFLQAIYGVTLGLLLITVGFDIMIITVLYRHWWAFRHIQTKSAVSLSILLRVMAFSIFRIVVAVAYGTVLNSPPVVQQDGAGDALSVQFGVPSWVDLLQASIPLVGFLVLGINGDMIDAMMFWRRKRRAMTSMPSVPTSGAISTASSTVWNDKGVLEQDAGYPNQDHRYIDQDPRYVDQDSRYVHVDV